MFVVDALMGFGSDLPAVACAFCMGARSKTGALTHFGANASRAQIAIIANAAVNETIGAVAGERRTRNQAG
jgi:hypothetical protein